MKVTAKPTTVTQACRKLTDLSARSPTTTSWSSSGDGQLHLLPFDALADDSGRFVAETKVVTYSASASAFYLLRQPERTGGLRGALLGVGAIPYDANTARKANTVRGYDVAKLANLPESKNE